LSTFFFSKKGKLLKLGNGYFEKSNITVLIPIFTQSSFLLPSFIFKTEDETPAWVNLRFDIDGNNGPLEKDITTTKAIRKYQNHLCFVMFLLWGHG